MRIVILTMFLVSIFTSCTKDKIGLMDKRNDCKNCELLFVYDDGEVVSGISFDSYQNITPKPYDSFCDLLRDLDGKELQDLHFDSSGNPILRMRKNRIKCK
jgi:hypothetical protein